MDLERLPHVPMGEELLDKALRRASRARRGKLAKSRLEAERSMITTSANILSDNLDNIVRKYPTLDELPEFYREMVDILIGTDKLKTSLASISWAAKKIREISKEHKQRLKSDQGPTLVRKQAVGRFSSIIKDIEGDLLFLQDTRKKLRTLPGIKDIPTIVVAGYPNVGKSSFIAMVSSAKPEIKSYPFTTRNVAVGHIQAGRQLFQIIDTPGLLDRPLSDRNEIELQAVSALRHLADVVLFMLDPSGTCGYPMERQTSMLSEMKDYFNVPMLVAANKSDIHGEDVKEADIHMSALTGEGVEEILKQLIDLLKCAQSSFQS